MTFGDNDTLTLAADVVEESDEAHRSGLPRTGTATVYAQLDASGIDVTPFLKAATGDLPEGVLIVLGEWYKSMFGPTGSATLTVHWHEPKRVSFTIAGKAGNGSGFSFTLDGTLFPAFNDDGSFDVTSTVIAVGSYALPGGCNVSYAYEDPKLQVRGAYKDSTQTIAIDKLLYQEIGQAADICGRSFTFPAGTWDFGDGLTVPLIDGASVVLPRPAGFADGVTWQGTLAVHLQPLQ